MKKASSTPSKKPPAATSREQAFTDEEIIALEQDFIDVYLKGNSNPLKILLHLYRPFWKELLLSLLFYFLKVLPALVLPLTISNIINIIATQDSQMWTKIGIQLGIMLILLIQNIPTTTLYFRFRSTATRRVEAGLRGAMVRKLQQLSISFYREMQSGRIQSKLIRDVETVQTLSDDLFSYLPALIINVTFISVVVIALNPWIYLFFLICIPIAVLLVRLFKGRISEQNAKFRRNTENASAGLTDMVEMTEISRAHALEQHEIHKMTHLLSNVANTGFHMDIVHAFFGSISWVMFSLFQLLCLGFCAWMAFSGQILVGDIALYQSYFTTLTGYISNFVDRLPAISKGLESVKSIGEILQNRNVEQNESKLQLEDLRGEYDFCNVRFSYEDDQPLLNGINLHIRAGETIAFVGESGSGKTTLLNLIIGFYTAKEGQVLIDGHDMKEVDLRSYRKHIAIVPQNSVLFTGTIRENLTYGIENVNEDAIYRALDAARLTNFIEKLPHGIDTELAEHGANLSGGQRQRLSIARAILRDPEVIILDEATSALDSISEREIQHAINNMAKGRTTFIVAHRLSTIRNADRIAVIKDGLCAEIGSYEELMESHGEFYRMQTAQ